MKLRIASFKPRDKCGPGPRQAESQQSKLLVRPNGQRQPGAFLCRKRARHWLTLTITATIMVGCGSDRPSLEAVMPVSQAAKVCEAAFTPGAVGALSATVPDADITDAVLVLRKPERSDWSYEHNGMASEIAAQRPNQLKYVLCIKEGNRQAHHRILYSDGRSSYLEFVELGARLLKWPGGQVIAHVVTGAEEAHLSPVMGWIISRHGRRNLFHTARVTASALSSDGAILAMALDGYQEDGATYPGGVVLRNVAGGDVFQAFPASQTIGLAISNDGRTLAIASRNLSANGDAKGKSGVRVWDILAGRTVSELPLAFDDPLLKPTLAFASGAGTLGVLYAGFFEGWRAVLWDFTSGGKIAQLGLERVAAVSPDSKLVAHVHSQEVAVQDLLSGKQVFGVPIGKGDTVDSLALSGGGRTLAIASHTGITAKVDVWNLERKRLIREFHIPFGAALRRMQLVGDGSRLVAFTYAPPMMFAWQIDSGVQLLSRAFNFGYGMEVEMDASLLTGSGRFLVTHNSYTVERWTEGPRFAQSFSVTRIWDFDNFN